MRITDSRYDRDRLRLTLAFRLIGHEARTHTIRQATGLSDDRIRKLFHDYVRDCPDSPIRRRRGKSPRQMAYFRRTLEQELLAATLGSMLRCCGLLARSGPAHRPSLDEVARFCDVFETFRSLCPACAITFDGPPAMSPTSHATRNRPTMITTVWNRSVSATDHMPPNIV